MTLTNDFLLTLGATVFHATALLTMTAIFAALSRRRSAAQRHLIWSLGLLGALCLLPLNLALLRLGPALPAGHRSTPSQALHPMPVTVSATTETTSAETFPAAPIHHRAYPVWPVCLALVWLSGFILVLARLFAGGKALRRVAEASEPILDGPLMDSVAGACRALPLWRTTDFRQASRSENVGTPMSWGFQRPIVILPTEADGWPPERVHAALLHELAHIARNDWSFQMLAQLTCALYWFHPLAWLAARGARAEAERACDDIVMAAGVGPADYAGHLVAVARSVRAGRAVPETAMAMARSSLLSRRLDAILEPNARRGSRTPRTLAAALILTAAGVCSLAALGPVAATKPGEIDPTALQGKIIVIDPGHGGQDTGAVVNGVMEKSLSAEIALHLKSALEQREATVYLTRYDDTFFSLMNRPRLAAGDHADFFISIHCDNSASKDYGGPGAVVFYHGHGSLGRRLAASVGAGIGAAGVDARTRSDLKRFSPGGFGVLRGAMMPAVLVECGDMVIPADMARLRDPEGQGQIAEGIAAGLTAFIKAKSAPASSTP